MSRDVGRPISELTEREDAIRRYCDGAADAIRADVDPDQWDGQLHWFAETTAELLEDEEGVDVDTDTIEDELRERLDV